MFCVYSWVYISEELCTKLFNLFVSLFCPVNKTLLRLIFFFLFDELLCQDFFFLCLKLFRNKYIYIYIHTSIIDTYPRAIDFIKVASAMNWVCLELSLWLGCLFLWRAAVFGCVGSAEGVFVLETKSWNSELGRTTASYCMQTLLHIISLHEAGPLPMSTLAATHLTRAMQLVCGGGFSYEFLAPLSTMHRTFVFQHAGNVPSDRNGASFVNC